MNETVEVAFVEFEWTAVQKIENCFPLFEKLCHYDLPKYKFLEGGISQDEDGKIHSTWEGFHYFLCIPVENIGLLKRFGKITYKVVKTVPKNQLNKDHRISYWGIGCDPTLKPL